MDHLFSNRRYDICHHGNCSDVGAALSREAPLGLAGASFDCAGRSRVRIAKCEDYRRCCFVALVPLLDCANDNAYGESSAVAGRGESG